MRAIWSGALSFGLVNIPIKLYSASEERELEFHMLHKEDLSPIRFARICRAEGKEIPYEDIVKGYEYSKGEFVILTEEDFRAANIRKTKTVDIMLFADVADIEPKFFDSPYYLEPAKGAEKPYVLLREVMKRTGQAGIGKFVLRQKEILCLIKPEGNFISLNRLRFSEQLRQPDDLKVPVEIELNDQELGLALQLVGQLSGKFEPEKFKDEYTKELKDVIEKKAKGETVAVSGQEPVPTRVADLMSVLEASLAKKGK